MPAPGIEVKSGPNARQARPGSQSGNGWPVLSSNPRHGSSSPASSYGQRAGDRSKQSLVPALQVTVDPSGHAIVVSPPTIGSSHLLPAPPPMEKPPWSTQMRPGAQSGYGPPVNSSKPSQSSPGPAGRVRGGRMRMGSSGQYAGESSWQSRVPDEHSTWLPSAQVMRIGAPGSGISLQYTGESSKQAASSSGHSSVAPLGQVIVLVGVT